MNQKLRTKKSVRIDVLIIGGLIGGAGWVCASFFMAKISHDDFTKTFSELILEFCKTVLVAAFVAFVLDRYLRGVFAEGKTARLAQAGISDVYPSRGEAVEDMRQCLQNASHIDIMGISLQDFLLPDRTFSTLWEAIEKRLIREEREKVHKGKRFRVRLLMLHPKSSEGLFRFSFEKSPEGGGMTGMTHDIRLGLDAVQRDWANIFRAGHGDGASPDQNAVEDMKKFLDVKLYHHCPFALVFLTNKHAFVEQYYYKDHTRHVDMPMLRYSKKEVYDEFQTCFDVVWNHAKPGILEDFEVGTAEAIKSCGIRNIFSKDQRAHSGDRQAETLRKCGPTTAVKILSISGKFYRSDRMIQELMSASKQIATVQFMLLNPVCEQAIFRAIADDHPARIKQELKTWNWGKHCETHLYKDTDQAITELRDRIDAAYKFEVHLHHSSPACSLFLTSKEAFIEQYIYGRSDHRMKVGVLGAEYPLFEFGCVDDSPTKDTAEMQMLSCTFDVIWKSYSIDIKKFLAL